MGIEYKNISDCKHDYRQELGEFVNKLSTEANYFPVTVDWILESVDIFMAKDNEAIVGVSGLEKAYYGLMKFYCILNKNYHDTGVGRRLILKQLQNAKKKYCGLLITVNENNIRIIETAKKVDFKSSGKIGGLEYLFKSYNFTGDCVYKVMKMLVPLVNKLKKY